MNILSTPKVQFYFQIVDLYFLNGIVIIENKWIAVNGPFNRLRMCYQFRQYLVNADSIHWSVIFLETRVAVSLR